MPPNVNLFKKAESDGINSTSFDNFTIQQLTMLLLAMVCDGSDPDLGSSAGVGGHDWDTSRIYQTNITLTCPFGQAFDTNYTAELVNTCDYQSDDATQVDWTYNANNALPNCIRKYYLEFTWQKSRGRIVTWWN